MTRGDSIGTVRRRRRYYFPSMGYDGLSDNKFPYRTIPGTLNLPRLSAPTAPHKKPDEPKAGFVLGTRIRELRRSKKLTLMDVAKKCGVSASGLSKIENGNISPTYGNLLRIAHGLAVSVSDIVTESPSHTVTARRSVCRRGQGVVYSIGTHSWEVVCTDLANKKMQPMIGRILASRMSEVSGLTSHPGEEVMYVVSGEVILHTEHYEPVRLKAGDCAYFDSTMGHRCLRASKREAVVFWVCSDARSSDRFVRNGQSGR